MPVLPASDSILPTSLMFASSKPNWTKEGWETSSPPSKVPRRTGHRLSPSCGRTIIHGVDEPRLLRHLPIPFARFAYPAFQRFRRRFCDTPDLNGTTHSAF